MVGRYFVGRENESSLFVVIGEDDVAMTWFLCCRRRFSYAPKILRMVYNGRRSCTELS